MRTSIFFVVSVVFASLAGSTVSSGADSDKGYGEFAPRLAPSSVRRSKATPETFFYKPTQRYYGKDYAVAYGFTPVERSTRRSKAEPLASPNITAGRVQELGGHDYARVILYRPQVSAPTTTVTETTTVTTVTPVAPLK